MTRVADARLPRTGTPRPAGGTPARKKTFHNKIRALRTISVYICGISILFGPSRGHRHVGQASFQSPRTKGSTMLKIRSFPSLCFLVATLAGAACTGGETQTVRI